MISTFSLFLGQHSWTPSLAFGIPSGPDLFVLLIIVVVLFGAKRLPEIARSLGQSVHEFKKAKQEFEAAANSTTPTGPAAPTAIATAPTPTLVTEKKESSSLDSQKVPTEESTHKELV